jgi:hypothetical protein
MPWRSFSNPVDQIQLKTFFTVTLAVPLLPSEVALMVAEPNVKALTSPVEDTVATNGLLDFQVTRRPVSIRPAASLRVALS